MRNAIRHLPAHGWRLLLTGWSLFCAAAWATPLAPEAQTPPPWQIAQWTGQAQTWINQQLTFSADSDHNADSPRLRPEVLFGQLDPRLRLAPCNRIEPYLPTGTRLWGRARIGLRCEDGPTRWNVFLPVTVKVWGPAWVIKQPVAPNAVLAQADAELAEIDWTESPATVLLRPEDWVGSQASRALMPGQALRQGMVRPPQAFEAGSQVKVQYQGQGFVLAATGEALSHGYIGQTARVRMPNRKVISGTVRDAETIEVAR